MKTRAGFVSNSSTTSFLLYGVCLDPDDVRKAFKVSEENEDDDVCELLEEKITKDSGLEYQSGQEGEYYYIGRSWDSVKDDETGAQFKESIKKAIEKLLGKEVKCGTHEEAWRDG